MTDKLKVDEERAKFEAWLKSDGWSVERCGEVYNNISVNIKWGAWLARAQLETSS